MAHPFPGKIEVIPKRRRNVRIGDIKLSDLITNEKDATLPTCDLRESSLQVRESSMRNGLDVFRSLLSKNLSQSYTDINAGDGQNVEESDDSDIEPNDRTTAANVDPTRDRNNFLGFNEFQVAQLIQQLRKISKLTSQNAFNSTDVSEDEDVDAHTQELPTESQSSDRGKISKRKILKKPAVKSVKSIQAPRTSLQDTRVTRQEINAAKIVKREKIVPPREKSPPKIEPDLEPNETQIEPEPCSSISKLKSKPIKKAEKKKIKNVKIKENNSKKKVSSKSEKLEDIEEDEKVVKERIVAIPVVKKKDNKKQPFKVHEKLVKKFEKEIKRPVVEKDEKEKIGKRGKEEKNVEKEDKKVEKEVEKMIKKKVKKLKEKSKIGKRVVINKVCNNKNSNKKLSNKKLDKIGSHDDQEEEPMERKVVKKVAVAKGLAVIKSLWRERMTKLNKPESVVPIVSSSPAAHLSSSVVPPVSEHSSINSPRTPSILREARLHVDLSKLSPMILNQNAPSPSSSSSISSSVASEEEQEDLQPVEKPPVTKKGKKSKSISKPKASKSLHKPGKKRPGEINCPVCRATKFYAHKQRRFGQYSCESCSKFFYNYLKTPTAFFCDNHGDCVIGSNISRCRACWLKICLQTYTIPEETRSNLTKNNFLPKLQSAPHVSLISVDTANVNNHEPVITHSSTEIATTSAAEGNRDRSKPNMEIEAIEPTTHTDGLLMMVPGVITVAVVPSPQHSIATSSPGSQVSMQQQPSPAPKSLKDIRVKRGKVVFAQKDSPLVSNVTTPTIQLMTEDELPTKMRPTEPIQTIKSVTLPKSIASESHQAGIRGPRTKNVCRTSLTGLPRATFGSIDDEDEREEDFGISEENVDSDDSDNIPLHDYIWKVIAEDQAAKTAVNSDHAEPISKKTTKKAKASDEAGNRSGKKSNGVQVPKAVTKKMKIKKDLQVSNGNKSASEPDGRKPKTKKVRIQLKPSKEVSSRNGSQKSKEDSKPDLHLPIVSDEKVNTPCIANFNSDTDIEEMDEEKLKEKETLITKTKKKTKRKSGKEDNSQKTDDGIKKSKKKKLKKMVEESLEEAKVLPLNIITPEFCSCPVPVLTTPPDQIDPNGYNTTVIPVAYDNESPIKKKKNKKKQKDNTEDMFKEEHREMDQKSPTPKKKKERTPSSDRKKARKRCNECSGCKADDCGSCAPCKDKKKFGGPNVRKQACKMRRCLQLFSSGSFGTNDSFEQMEDDDEDKEELNVEEPIVFHPPVAVI